MIVVVGWMIVPLAERSTTGCGAGCRLAASAGITEAARKPLNAAAMSGRMTDTMRSPVSRSRYSSLICQPSIVLLSRRFMSALGQKRTLTHVHGMSALPPKADIAERRCHVRFVPKADSCTAAILSLFEHLVGLRKQRRRLVMQKGRCDAMGPTFGHGHAIVLNPAYVQRLDFCTEFLSVCAILAADVCHRILIRWRSS